MAPDRPLLAMTASTGWAVRNFFQTGVVAGLLRDFRVLVITTPAIHAKLVEQGYTHEVECIVRDDLAEPRSWRYMRQIRKKLYMDSRKSATDAIWERYVQRPFYQRVGGWFMAAIVRLFDVRRLLRVAEFLDFRFNRSARADAILALYQPEVVFATHASSYFEESLLHEATRRRIPVVFMVLSWDHLSSKVVMSGRYDRVIVWNRITKAEILRTSDAYDETEVSVVGVPQFDCYAGRPTQTYAQWCARHGLDPSRRTVLFSTMPQVRHDHQHEIICQLLVAIREGRELPGDLQVLIKCHPFDNTDKYDPLLDGTFPVEIYRSTLPIGQPQDDWFPSAEEMAVARDALYFCSVNINIFSTVTLEAAYLDKPIVHIAFDAGPVSNRIPCREYYRFDHFRNIAESGASILVESYEELFAALRSSLQHPAQRAQQRKALVDDYFHGAPGFAAQAVVDCIREFHDSRAGGRTGD